MKKEAVSADRLVSVYIKIRDQRAKLKEDFENEDSKLKTQVELIREEMDDLCKVTNATSLKTNTGTIIRSLKTTYFTSDWGSFHDFVLEHKVPELFQQRIHQGNLKQWIEEHPSLIPMGLNTNSSYEISVRRK